jgi:hypothetical protein
MAHCPYKNLDDLKDCLAAIRQWPGIVEPKPGIFYLGRTAFHFHLTDGVRTADIRKGKNWGSVIEVPIGTSPSKQKRFLFEVKRRYKTTFAIFGPKASRPRLTAPPPGSDGRTTRTAG